MSVESRLLELEESLRKLRDANRLQARPLSAKAPAANEVLTWNATTKKWEPSTYSGANLSDKFTTRTVQMTTTQLPSTDIARFADGAGKTTLRLGFFVPADWVASTDIILTTMLFSTGTGTVVTESLVTAHPDNETQSLGNLENETGLTTSMVATKTNVYERTITGSGFAAGDFVSWALTRDSDNASDNLTANLDAFYGAHASYTSLF